MSVIDNSLFVTDNDILYCNCLLSWYGWSQQCKNYKQSNYQQSDSTQAWLQLSCYIVFSRVLAQQINTRINLNIQYSFELECTVRKAWQITKNPQKVVDKIRDGNDIGGGNEIEGARDRTWDKTFCVYFVLLVNSDVHCFRFVVCTESYAGNKS